MADRFAGAIRRSLDEVLDGQRTGRYSLDQLSKVEKTYVGTKVEIIVQAEFGLQRGHRMDYLVAGEEVDAKWSMRSGGWMIPVEAVGEFACASAMTRSRPFQWDWCELKPLGFGLTKSDKRRPADEGMSSMAWLKREGRLVENLISIWTTHAVLDSDYS